MEKTGRNDTCPCGSGKKYKSCCLEKSQAAGSSLPGTRKFTAKLISGKGAAEKTPDGKEHGQFGEVSGYHTLMERSFGHALHGEEGFPSVK